MRNRVTIRGDHMDLRGYVDGDENLHEIADGLHRVPAVMTASQAPDDYYPFDKDEDPELEGFLQEAKLKLPILIGDSAVTVMMLDHGSPDPKFCIELGYSISFDKPIILIVATGAHVPNKLVKIADEILEWDGGSNQERLNAAIERVISRQS